MIPEDRHVPQRVLLVRHGQTEWNREGRLHGQLDSPLTADGIAQASAVAERLVPYGVRTVCSSPLGRALRTAVIIAERLSADLVEVPELTELHLGDMAGMTRAEIEDAFPGAREARAENRYGWAFPAERAMPLHGDEHEQPCRRAGGQLQGSLCSSPTR